MNRIEIIEIRVIHHMKEKLENDLKRILEELRNETGEQTIKLYKRIRLETDYVILLVSEPNDQRMKNTQIGLRLNELLKNYGMVNHSEWCEMK
jgi:hypothetical protein